MFYTGIISSRIHYFIMAFGFTMMTLPVWASEPPEVTAMGVGTNLQIAQDNSWAAAHFACNRKGFWADLDTVKNVSTDRSSYTIAGGRKKINQYKVNVRANCGINYQRYPSDQQPSD